MADQQAWGHVEKTRRAAEESAEAHMYRLATSRGEVVKGQVHIEETRSTPTGFQSRATATLVPMQRNGRHG